MGITVSPRLSCLSLALGTLLFALLFCSLLDRVAQADAIVTVKAMTATTILEIFVDDDKIRCEFEVGTADLEAFANLLPDKLYEQLTGYSRPLQERLREFLNEDWIVLADGEQLSGRFKSIAPGKRIARDEITGDPLNPQPAEAEGVLRFQLEYPLTEKLSTLTIRSFADSEFTPNIGFIGYHRDLPINDFRYLPREVSLTLDWRDPWYSQFEHRNLQRQYSAPLNVFLYVEPYEVRQEIVVRPQDLQQWLDLGLDGKDKIPVEDQAELKQQVADFLLEKSPVTVDGQPIIGRLDRIHFIRRSLRTTGVIDPPEELDTTSALLGVIFVYPIEKLPNKVTLDWQLFSTQIQVIPAVASDEAGGLPAQITPESPKLEWQNFLTDPTDPKLAAIKAPPQDSVFRLPVLSAICFGAFVFLMARQGRAGQAGRPMIATIACLVGAVALYPVAGVELPNPFSQPAQVSEESAAELLTNLLYNVYRAFDHHDESVIYDRLATGISGDLLSEVYLETRRSMEVKNQGGLRISVKDVSILDLDELQIISPNEFTCRCRWQVAGWIGHWGHIHRRANQHLANLKIAADDGKWKITAVEMLDEQSLDATTGRPSEFEGSKK